MADEDARHEHLVNVYAQQQASLVDALLRALLQIWLPFLWWGRPDMVNAAAAASAVQVDTITRRARRIARAYMIRQLELIGALPDTLPPIEDTYERGGTPINEVYKRPARQLEHLVRERWKRERELADGDDPWDEPWDGTIENDEWDEFQRRLESLVEDDVAATLRDESQKVIESAEKVIGYRRVIHPERSKTGSCGLCVVASSRFYTKSELMPMHDRCKCSISPITATQDLGLRLNREDLDEIYAVAGGNYAEDLKKIKVVIRENGELGPILTREGQHFRDVATVNRSSKRKKFTPYKRMTPVDQEKMWTAMRETSERSIRILEDARARGTNLVDMTGRGRLIPVADIEQAIAYHRSLIERALARLA